MCGLFGFSDLQHSLTEKQASALANSLARASAVRGQDATGIAYVQSGKLRIYKRPKPAARMQLRLPKGTTQLLGHVRMTTQGSEKKNYNNHPFRGALPGGDFALAHNGVLHNETGIRLRFNLPQTAVETDSCCRPIAAKLWRGDTADHCCYGRTVGGDVHVFDSDFRK